MVSDVTGRVACYQPLADRSVRPTRIFVGRTLLSDSAQLFAVFFPNSFVLQSCFHLAVYHRLKAMWSDHSRCG